MSLYPTINKDLTNQKWICPNEEDSTNIWTLSQFIPGFIFNFPKFAKSKPIYHFIEFKGSHIRWVVPEAYTKSISQNLLNKVLKSPQSYKHLQLKLKKICDRLYVFSKSLKRLNLKKLSSDKLANIFDTQLELVTDVYGCGLVSTMTEFPEPIFTEHIQKIITDRIKKLGLKRPASEYFDSLSAITQDSIQKQEDNNLVKIAWKFRKNRQFWRLLKGYQLNSTHKIFDLIREHINKYDWAYYGYIGPILSVDHVINRLNDLHRQNKLSEIYSNITKTKNNIGLNIKRVERDLRLTKHEVDIFRAYRTTQYMKLYRKDAVTYSIYTMEPVIKEFANRVGLSFKHAQAVLPGEHRKILLGNISSIKTLPARIKYCIYLGINLKPTLLIGKSAKVFMSKFLKKEKFNKIKELTGQTACLGKVIGRVKIINSVRDLKKMKFKNILVAASTAPDLVPAMKKAGAIITDIGGITSHAAIVSRELKIPCVIGTKVATKVFKDGDRVEVDAYKGIVKKI